MGKGQDDNFKDSAEITKKGAKKGNEKKIPTMKDVAREAGVALGTVSKVINGVQVGEEYKTRVEQAIRKLDYSVNTYARSLKSNKAYAVAVIVPNIINPFFGKLVHYLNESLARQDYRMYLWLTEYDYKQEQKLIDMARQRKVDGIICLSYNPQLEVPKDIPFVSIDRYFGVSVPCVSSDNYGGGWLAAEKLVENGCRRLAYMRLGSRLANEPNKRKNGFVDYCEQNGIEYAVKQIDDGTPYSVFEDFLRENYNGDEFGLDGIFCVTDSLAYQVIKSLHSMGLRVPEDVQLIGFDGIRHLGDQDLVCSTIEQNIPKLASTCVELVLNGSKDGTQPSLICLPVNYLYGGTTLK